MWRNGLWDSTIYPKTLRPHFFYLESQWIIQIESSKNKVQSPHKYKEENTEFDEQLLDGNFTNTVLMCSPNLWLDIRVAKFFCNKLMIILID